MQILRLILVLLGAALPASCSAAPAPVDTGKVEASSIDEDAERQSIIDRVQVAINSHDFAALDAMERDYRTSRARTPSGVWKLGVYHASLQYYLADGLTREAGCKYRKADFVNQWRAAQPDHPGR